MSAEYLGEVTGIITTEELTKIVQTISGKLFHNGDIPFLKFLVDGKEILISGKGLVSEIAWTALDAINLTSKGQVIVFNNHRYLCRSLSSSEWNTFIVNLTPGNELSGWNGFKTLSSDLNGGITATNCFGLGGSRVNEISQINKSVNYANTGWRAVLEILNYPPSLSIVDENLGNLLTWLNKNYVINEKENENFTLTEKLDRTIIRTLENQTSGTEYTLDLSDRWDNLSYGKHTIEIIATDTNGLSSTVTIKFNKIKVPIQKLPSNASLIDRANFAVEQNKELEYQCIRLENYLKEKGVEVAVQEKKMSTLISKIKNIKTPIFTVGNNLTLYKDDTAEPRINSSSYTYFVKKYKFISNGDYRLTARVQGQWDSARKDIKIVVLDGERVVTEKELTTNNADLIDFVLDCVDVKEGYEFRVMGKAYNSSYGIFLRELIVDCNMELR